VEETSARAIGLDPFSVDNELGNGAFAYVAQDFFDRSGGRLDVDFSERDVVLLEEALGFAAVAAPGGGVEGDWHACYVREIPASLCGSRASDLFQKANLAEKASLLVTPEPSAHILLRSISSLSGRFGADFVEGTC